MEGLPIDVGTARCVGDHLLICELLVNDDDMGGLPIDVGEPPIDKKGLPIDVGRLSIDVWKLLVDVVEPTVDVKIAR